MDMGGGRGELMGVESWLVTLGGHECGVLLVVCGHVCGESVRRAARGVEWAGGHEWGSER